MAEDFALVRTYRQHLKRGAALLDEGRLDDALHEVEQALALDPHGLPAQALRDRIRSAQLPAKGFVPQGVNAASWRGFEQRITDRRFRALIDTANSAIVAANPVAARMALEEARELKPEAPELPDLDARLAAVPLGAPLEPVPAARIWMRAIGAAAMFLVGVSLLIGVEWLRPIDTITPAAAVLTDAPAVSPAQDFRAVAPPPGPAVIDVEDQESVPAIITPPEPLLRPRGTTGTLPATETRPVARNDERSRPEPPAARIARAASLVDTAPLRALEVSDDFVTRPDAARPDVARAENTSGPIETAAVERPVIEASATVVPAAVVPAPDRSGVEEVLRRYASAYGALDARAARAVWPSVDEKALAHAFRNLASQNVSFDDCDINIRGEVANASCRGQASYVGKVGSREPRTESRSWQFELRRAGDGWMIEGVDARRLSQASFYRD